MAWIPIKGALRKIRQSKKMTRAQLAKRSGIEERTIRRHEKRPPRTIRDETATALAIALECAADAFAKWVTNPGDDPNPSPPIRYGEPAPLGPPIAEPATALGQLGEKVRELARALFSGRSP